MSSMSALLNVWKSIYNTSYQQATEEKHIIISNDTESITQKQYQFMLKFSS